MTKYWAFLIAACLVTVNSIEAGETMPRHVTFDGVDFVHRKSDNDEQVFTPVGQENLSKWSSVLAIIYLPDVRSHDALLETVTNFSPSYGKLGDMVGIDFTPEIGATPEATVVTFELNVYSLETAEVVDQINSVSKIYLSDQGGVFAVHSYHRIAGKPSSEQLISAAIAMMNWDTELTRRNLNN